jgi:MFS family permease
MTIPTYGALIPELVGRDQLHAASGLGAISMNIARAVGPAVAGVLVVRLGPTAVFAINALTFVAFAVVLLLWRRHPTEDEQEPEPFLAAVAATSATPRPCAGSCCASGCLSCRVWRCGRCYRWWPASGWA